ncbi:MAG: class II aldolase/adducin family protein [Clostridia bacterium]
MTETQLREILVESGIDLLKSNLVQGTWGNTSVRLDEKSMLVTPSGLDYLSLKPEDMAKVDINTLEWEGKYKPTSEKGIHAGVYSARKEVGAVIHSHPTYCSVFASAHIPLPVINDKMKNLIGGEVRVSGYGLPGSSKLCKNTLIGLDGRNATFMANHGVLCVGKDMKEAFEIMATMEECCKLYIEQMTCKITGEKEFTQEILDNFFIKNFSK